MSLEPDRIEEGRPMLLAGLRRHYGFAEGPIEIPKDWEIFAAMLPLPDQVGVITYGATCGSDPAAQTFEYIAAAEVTTFDRLPDGLGRLSIRAATYAVFVHQGPLSGLRATWEAIHQWRPPSGYALAPTPNFERYGPGFDPATGAYDVEIWVPVTRP